MRAQRIPCDREPERQLACDQQHRVITPYFINLSLHDFT